MESLKQGDWIRAWTCLWVVQIVAVAVVVVVAAVAVAAAEVVSAVELIFVADLPTVACHLHHPYFPSVRGQMYFLPPVAAVMFAFVVPVTALLSQEHLF